MITAKGVFEMETDLLNSIDPAWVNGDTYELSEEDKKIFDAFSAVQDLREYLEGKERSDERNRKRRAGGQDPGNNRRGTDHHSKAAE